MWSCGYRGPATRGIALVGRRHEARRQGGDAREVAQEVQRRPLGREDRAQRPGDLDAPCRRAPARRRRWRARPVSSVGTEPAEGLVGAGAGRPGPRPGGPAGRSCAVARLGTSAAVRSPSGPRSSARARPTASVDRTRRTNRPLSGVRRHAGHRHCAVRPAAGATTARSAGTRPGRGPRGSRCGPGPRPAGRRPAAPGWPARRRPPRSPASARPRPRSSTTRRAAACERAGDRDHAGTPGHRLLQHVAQLGHVGRRPAEAGRARPAPARGRQRHPGRRARCTRSRRCGASPSTARSAPLGSGPPGAARDALGQPGPEDHPLEQRVGGQPVGPVHAGAGHLAHGPQPGQGGGAPEVGDARRPRGGGRRGRWAASPARGRARWRRATPRWWGSAGRSARARWHRARGGRRPGSAIRAAMARLTTSRGASSSTKRSPSRSRSRAPWPRSASESRGRGMAGWCSAVGWNCTNSTSAVGTPARRAMATPSPVDSAGLVVTENSCPAPPVASTTWSARTSTGALPPPGGEGRRRRRSGRPRSGDRGRTSPRARRWPMR